MNVGLQRVKWTNPYTLIIIIKIIIIINSVEQNPSLEASNYSAAKKCLSFMKTKGSLSSSKKKSPLMVPIVSKINPIHILATISLTSIFRLFSNLPLLLRFRFIDWRCVSVFHMPHAFCMSILSHYPHPAPLIYVLLTRHETMWHTLEENQQHHDYKRFCFLHWT